MEDVPGEGTDWRSLKDPLHPRLFHDSQHQTAGAKLCSLREFFWNYFVLPGDDLAFQSPSGPALLLEDVALGTMGLLGHLLRHQEEPGQAGMRFGRVFGNLGYQAPPGIRESLEVTASPDSDRAEPAEAGPCSVRGLGLVSERALTPALRVPPGNAESGNSLDFRPREAGTHPEMHQIGRAIETKI